MRLCWHLGTLGATEASSEIQTSVAIFTACLNVYIISCESQALLATAIIILFLPISLLSRILTLLYLYCSFCLFYLYHSFLFSSFKVYPMYLADNFPLRHKFISTAFSNLISAIKISVTRHTRINGILCLLLSVPKCQA